MMTHPATLARAQLEDAKRQRISLHIYATETLMIAKDICWVSRVRQCRSHVSIEKPATAGFEDRRVVGVV